MFQFGRDALNEIKRLTIHPEKAKEEEDNTDEPWLIEIMNSPISQYGDVRTHGNITAPLPEVAGVFVHA